MDQLFHDAPEEYREALRSELTPFLHQSLDSLSGKLLPYFQWHCDMGEFEMQLEEQADMLPENEQGPFRSGVREALDGLRQSLNLGVVAEPPALYREQSTPVQEAGRAPDPIPDVGMEPPLSTMGMGWPRRLTYQANPTRVNMTLEEEGRKIGSAAS